MEFLLANCCHFLPVFTCIALFNRGEQYKSVIKVKHG